MKKTLSILLAITLILNLCACAKTTTAAIEVKKIEKYKIGIMTGTTFQNEEEFWAAESMAKQYGDMVVFDTYPDNFVKEQYITREKLLKMAKDPDVKAIVMCQVVQGAASALTEVRKMRPDILIIAAVTSEHLKAVVKSADIVMQGDELAYGYTIPAQAKKLGAKTFVHYSFPRHMTFDLLSSARDIMKDECLNMGMRFIDVNIPDPLGYGGLEASKDFVEKDIKSKIKKYGKDINFYSTNCGVQETLIKTALDCGGIVAQQCCPSPLHGYPAALGLKIPQGKISDSTYVINEIKKGIAKKGGTGRFSTWPMPMNMMFVEAGVEYAKGYIEGTITSRNDPEALAGICSVIAGGKDIKLNVYTGKDENGKDMEYDNFYLLLCDYITF